MTNPVALATTVWGDGPRRALLIHGLTSAGSTWWRTGAALAAMGFTAVAPDLRSHGASPAGDSLSLESHRDDVLLLGGGWDLVVGHSLGGAIVAMAATARPDIAERVVLEDPAIDSATTARFVKESPEPVAAPTIAGIAAEHPSWDRRDVEEKVKALLACRPDVTERTIADASPWDTWPDVLGLKVPTLLLGADPSIGSLVSADRGEDLPPDSNVRLARIPGAGHSMHRDNFTAYLAQLERFLGE